MKIERICITVPDSVRRLLRVAAAKHDMNLSELIRLAIEHYIRTVLEKE